MTKDLSLERIKEIDRDPFCMTGKEASTLCSMAKRAAQGPSVEELIELRQAASDLFKVKDAARRGEVITEPLPYSPGMIFWREHNEAELTRLRARKE